MSRPQMKSFQTTPNGLDNDSDELESQMSSTISPEDASLYALHNIEVPKDQSGPNLITKPSIQVNGSNGDELVPGANALQNSSSSTKSLRFSVGGGIDRSRAPLKGHPVLTVTNAHGAYQNNSNGSPNPARRLSSFNSNEALTKDNESIYSEIASSFSNKFLLNFVHRGNPLKAGGLGKEYWIDDSSATKCFLCEKNFNTFRRKHHCRICGQIFCSSCTLFISGEKFNYNGKMRVCKSCLAYADKYDDMVSSDESTVEENNNNIAESIYPAKSNETNTSSMHPSLRTASFLDQDLVIQAPTPPPKMAIPATRHGAAVEIPSRDLVQRNNSLRRRRPRFSQSNHNFRSGVLANTQRLVFDDDISSSNDGKGRSNSLKFFQQNSPNSSPNLFNLGQHKSQSNSILSPLFHDTRLTQNSSDPLKLPSPANKFGISDDESEDEQSISLYENLHGDNYKSSDADQGLFDSRSSSQAEATDVKTRLARLNSQTRSERAQASLWRMKNRRRAKTTSRLTPTSYQAQQYIGGLHRPKTANIDEDTFKNLVNNNRQTTFDFSGVSDKDEEVSSFGGALANSITSKVPSDQKVFSLPNRDLKLFMEEHANNLLRQCLSDEALEDLPRWDTVLFNILKQISEINPDVRAGDSFDIRQYVKLKRIPGASIEDSAFIDGVVFSKNVALKTMPKELNDPRICLITFPIEFTKSEQHFMSLDLIMAQEKESLHKLVGRIIALNPDLLFVGDSISGLALEMLDNAGIIVVYNVKPQVIERIAKLTDADVVTSIDKLAVNPKLGACQKFEVKQYLYQEIKRSYIILSGCNKANGGTILLRGSNQQVLKKVKGTIEFLIYVFFNLRPEYSLFRDEYLTVVSQDLRKQTELDGFQSSYCSDFIEKFNTRHLSSSAVIKFYLPPLLYKAREADDKLTSVVNQLAALREDRQKFIELNSEESGKELANDLTSDLEGSVDILKVNVANEDEFRIGEYILQQKIESLKLSLHSWQRQWELFCNHSPYLLEPTSHQSLLFLYTMVNSKTTAPCVGPETLGIDYYWMSDISLGQYIEHISLTANGECPEGCGSNLMDHFRSYVHGNGKVDVIVEPFQSRIPGLQNVILMWSYCKQCRQSTPVIPMSENTWMYSFGKYLELSFWSENVKLIGTCPHDFKQHIRYFGIYNLAVRMEYSKVDTLELVVPKFKLHWKPDIDIKLKISSLDNVKAKSDAFFDSVWERLIRVKVDSMTIDKMETGQRKIQELKEKVQLQKAEIVAMSNEIYNRVEVTEHLPLNAAIRKIQELSVQWDMEFQDFEVNFLPSENDITRITSSQLRKLFMEKEPQENSKEPENDAIAKDDIIDLEKNLSEKLEEVASSPEDHRNEKSERTTRTVLGPHVSEQVHKMEAIVGDFNNLEKSEARPDLSPTKQKFATTKLPPKSAIDGGAPKIQRSGSAGAVGSRFPRLGTNELELELRKDNSDNRVTPNGKVKQLTSLFDQLHFDQISMEFELQRERERRKLVANRYRAIPVIASKPIVEVYKNVHDAVEEEVSDDESSSKPAKKKTSAEVEETPPPKKEEEGDAKVNDKDNKKPNSMPPTERASLIKTLTSFWADRSAALWKPLAYPLSSTEHIFVDSDVIVREDEPSSLIAFCLSSSDYVSKLQIMRENTPLTNNTSDVASIKKVAQPLQPLAAPVVQSADTAVPPRETTSLLEKIMLKKTAIHLKYQFQEGSSLLSCKIFFAEQFDAFRQECGIDANFVQSLSRCVKWDSTGGKSGSAFLKTLDDRFIIKELSHTELDAFVKFAPSYFEYLAQALFHDLPTVLAKIFGFYQIHIRNPIDNKNIKIDLLIMENLFYDRKTSRIFDLKGSMRNRHVEQTGKANEVLLDENMVEYIYESPLFVKEYAKKLLRTSLWNDTLFLSRMNVMDYSLVIGIDSENQELVVGIIDCIRTFTWDKKLESWVKEKGLVGGGGKEPTVVTPRQYKNRFRDAMDRYILMVPDCWNQGPIE